MPSDRRKVVLGQIAFSFYAVSAAVVRALLERLGHEVTVKEGLHEALYPMLGRGEVDLFVAACLPNGHGLYWERHGERAVRLAPLFEGTRYFFGVPDYVPADRVASIADLARPDVAARTTRTVQSIGPGAGLTAFSREAIAAYGLDAAGYELRTGTAAEWARAFEDRVARRQWVVVPLWVPQWLNRAYRIRALEDPKKSLREPDTAFLLAHRDFAAGAAARTLEVLRRIRIGIEAVTDMDYAVNAEGQSPREAAEGFLAGNDAAVQTWLRP